MNNVAQLRAIIAPEPTYYYPTPWRVAETRQDYVVVTCSTGSYTANCPNDDVAEVIVAAVNAYAAPAPAGDRLRCPVCGIGAIWATDDGTTCTNPNPNAGGAPGCGAEWDACGGWVVK
jgi:hypothetical protein